MTLKEPRITIPTFPLAKSTEMAKIESVRAEQSSNSALSLLLKLALKVPWYGWAIALGLLHYYFTKKPVKSTRSVPRFVAAYSY